MKVFNILCRFIIIASITIAPSCKKQHDNPKPNPPGGGAGLYSFANTEWTGVAGTYGQTYQQPCYLKFNGDTTVVLYALFHWFIGNDDDQLDSVTGKITAVDTSAPGATTIQVTLPFTHDQQVWTISNQNLLVGSAAVNSPAIASTEFSLHLQLCPAAVPSMKGTSWFTDISTITSGTKVVDFPDLGIMSFDENNQISYIRNGKIVTYTPPTQDQLVKEGFSQRRWLVYFAGYNEEKDLLIQYFGVLSADGETLLADTRAPRVDARLPSYISTFDYYGPPGVTPNAHKQH
jgi:hypothetical protein